MAKDLYFTLLVLITLILDLASGLYLSQESAIKHVGDTFIVICKDKERGQQVTWRGPNDVRLGQRTRPQVQTSSFGTAIMFKNAREEDSGDYTCSTNGSPHEKSVFSLTVEEEYSPPDTTVITDIPKTTAETNVPSPVTETNNNEKPNTEIEEPITVSSTTTEEIIVITTPKEETEVPPTSTEIVINTHKIYTTTTKEPNESSKDKNRTVQKANNESDLVFKDTNSTQYAVEGDNSTLRCEVNKKDANIVWLFENNEPVGKVNNITKFAPKYEIIGDGLLIRNVTREDGKVYICQAIHRKSGSLKSQNIKVVVQHIPKDVYARDTIVYGFLHEKVNLTCEVEAEPNPVFTWTSKQNGEDINMSKYIIEQSSHKSVLQITLTENHNKSIEYKCNVSNNIGELDIYFTVQVALQPDPPLNLTLTEAKPDSLQLEITLPGPSEKLVNGSIQPHYLVVKYRINETEEEWYEEKFNITSNPVSVPVLLKPLKKNTTYEVQAALENVGGLSDYIFELFTTSSAPQSVHATLPIFSVILVYLSILIFSEMREA